MKKYLFSLMLIVLVFGAITTTIAYSEKEWVEEDFALYNDDMTIYQKPHAADNSSQAYLVKVNMADKCQTWRGIKPGVFAEELAQ